MKTFYLFQQKNHGVVLPIGMVFLILLSVLSIGALKDVLLEEKMAGNFSDKQIADLRAESALNAVEGIFLRSVSTSTLQSSQGFNDNEQSPLSAPDFRNSDWYIPSNVNTIDSISMLTHSGAEVSNPNYPVAFVEKLSVVESLTKGKGDDDSENAQHFYRFTVRATGYETDTSTTLQSVVRQ